MFANIFPRGEETAAVSVEVGSEFSDLAGGAPACPRSSECPTLNIWSGYYKLTLDYFDGITLADLLRGTGGVKTDGKTVGTSH